MEHPVAREIGRILFGLWLASGISTLCVGFALGDSSSLFRTMLVVTLALLFPMMFALEWEEDEG